MNRTRRRTAKAKRAARARFSAAVEFDKVLSRGHIPTDIDVTRPTERMRHHVAMHSFRGLERRAGGRVGMTVFGSFAFESLDKVRRLLAPYILRDMWPQCRIERLLYAESPTFRILSKSVSP